MVGKSAGGPDILKPNKRAMLQLLQSGDSRLVWAKYEDEPFWPALTLSSWEILETFINPKEYKDEFHKGIPKGRHLVFFLAECVCELLPPNCIRWDYRSRKPTAQQLAADELYVEAVTEADALLRGLEVIDPLVLSKLQDSYERGYSMLVQAWVTCNNHTFWWPCLGFDQFELAALCGVRMLGLKKEIVNDREMLVYRLGGLSPYEQWEYVKSWLPFEGKNTESPSQKKALEFPDEGYRKLYTAAWAQALSLLKRSGKRSATARDHHKRKLAALQVQSATPRSDPPQPAVRTIDGLVEMKPHVNDDVATPQQKRQKRSRPDEAKTLAAEASGEGGPTVCNDLEKLLRMTDGILQTKEVDAVIYEDGKEEFAMTDGSQQTFKADLGAFRRYIACALGVEKDESAPEPGLNAATLARLEYGIRMYIGLLTVEVHQAERDSKKFASDLKRSIGVMESTTAKVQGDLLEAARLAQRMMKANLKLQAQATGLASQAGLNAVAQEALVAQEAMQTVFKAFSVLQEATSPFSSSAFLEGAPSRRQELQTSIAAKARMAFTIGSEVTQDQITAARYLLLWLEMLQCRLVHKIRAVT